MRKRAIFATFVLACLSLVARGSAPAVSAPNPIVIGFSISVSGEISDAALYLRQGYELWAKEINAKGGLLGRQVQLKYYDDQSDPQTSARLYERLITQDKVDLVISPYGSAVSSAASTVAEKYHMVFPAIASTPSLAERGYKYVFLIPASSRNYYHSVVDIAGKMGYKTMAILGEDSDYPRDAVPATAEYAQAHGMKVVYQDFYPPKTTDFSSYIAHIKGVSPDVLLNAGFTPEDLGLLHDLKGQSINLKQLVLGIGASLPSWAKNAGPDGNYVMSASQYEPSVSTPGNKEFVAEFEKTYGRLPDYRASQAYGACQVLSAAIDKAKSLDQAKLREAVGTLDFSTVFNHFKIDAKGAQIGSRLFLTQWLNGKKEIVYPADMATAKYQLPVPPWNKR